LGKKSIGLLASASQVLDEETVLRAALGETFPDNSLLIPWSVQARSIKMRVSVVPDRSGKKFPVKFPDRRISANYQAIEH
jgi:hypothetical protein